MALVALAWKRWDFSLGAVAGSILACVGLVHLKVTLSKTLAGPGSAAPTGFLVSSTLRWGIWAVILFLLLKVSVVCLLGAAGAYLGHLIVLAWNGLRAAQNSSPGEASSAGGSSKKDVPQ